MKDELNLLLILYSRNNGDYIPDYEFDNLLTSLESHIKSLLKKQRDIIIEDFASNYRHHVENDWTINMGAIIDWIKDAPEPVK